MREFVTGVRLLAAGFGRWRTHPRQMLAGLVPALIVATLLLAAIVSLGLSSPRLVDALTPFADHWAPLWATLVRIAVGTALVGAAIALSAAVFTALTLIIGDPFYERIWRAVELERTGVVPHERYGMWRTVGDGLSLIARGAGVAVIAALLGLIPVIGGAASFVVGVTLSGAVLADELATRGLAARGIQADARARLRRAHRGRVLGFGIATQLCFLVPLGAVFTMPAAVAGAATLAGELADDLPATQAPAG